MQRHTYDQMTYDDRRLDRLYASYSNIFRWCAVNPCNASFNLTPDRFDAEVADCMAYGLYSFGDIRPREKADLMVSEYMKRRGRSKVVGHRLDNPVQVTSS